MLKFLFNTFQKPKASKRRRRSAIPFSSKPCEVLENRLLLTLTSVETHVNTTTAHDQYESVNASNASGASVVVWTSALSLTDTDIYAQRFDAAGNKVGSQISVAHSSRLESTPSVSMDSTGDFVVVWVDQVSSSNSNVLAQRYTAAGALRGSVITVAGSTKNESQPSVASAANGNFVVSYTLQYSSSDYDVLATRYSDSGAIQSSISVSISSLLVENSSKVTEAPDGRFAIALAVNGINDSNHNVVLARYSATGAFLGMSNIATGQNDQTPPSVSMDDNANTVVTWQETVGSFHDIDARVVSNTGVIGAITTMTHTTDKEFDNTVAFRRSGGIYVVCYTQQSAARQVHVTEVNSAAGTIRAFLTVATQTTAGSISFGAGNNYSLSYTTLLSRSNDTDYGVFRRRGTV